MAPFPGTTSKSTLEDSYVVVEDFKDTMIHPREEITTLFDFFRPGRDYELDPEAALTVEFMTKGRRVLWCTFLPVNDNTMLSDLYQSNDFPPEEMEDTQILGVRMQILNEELFKKKRKLAGSTISINNALLENIEYYCAYVDYAGNQYIAKFKVPPLEPVKYHKYKLRGKLVKDLAHYSKHLVPRASYVRKLIK